MNIGLAITGGGSIDSQAVVTDTSGYASLGLGPWAPNPIYDLLSVDGKQVPISLGNDLSQDGGSYVLFDDGHCVFSWVFNGVATPRDCTFGASPVRGGTDLI